MLLQSDQPSGHCRRRIHLDRRLPADAEVNDGAIGNRNGAQVNQCDLAGRCQSGEHFQAQQKRTAALITLREGEDVSSIDVLMRPLSVTVTAR